MMILKRLNIKSTINLFLIFFSFKTFAQGPLPLTTQPILSRNIQEKKSEWKVIPEFKSLEFSKDRSQHNIQTLSDLSIDSNNINQEVIKTSTSRNAEVFHIPFRVNLIDHKKNQEGQANATIYPLQGILTWKADLNGQAIIQTLSIVNDVKTDYEHSLSLKDEVPLQLKQILETQSEIINSIMSKTKKSPSVTP